MSLKAKLEAVIYAAEEPVTLAQLAALFAAEALEWKAEREAEAAQAESQPEADEQLSILSEEFESAQVEQQDAETETVPEPVAEAPVAEAEAELAGPAGQADLSAPADAAEPAAEAPVDAEAEARRLARQRDREIKSLLRQALDEIIASYASDDRGIEIREIAGGYRMATKPECHDAVRLFIKSQKPPLKLSLPALETLAVIAYKQPVTAPEVNEIRGVESAGVLGSLLSRKLITTAGRKQVIGRPILYKTTKEFLLRFGLKDLSELPSMEEFEKMAAIELEETPAEAEPDDGYEPPPGSGPELDEDAPEDGDELEDEPADQQTSEPASQQVNPAESDAEAAATDESVQNEPSFAEPQQPAPPTEPEPDEPGQNQAAETEKSPHD